VLGIALIHLLTFAEVQRIFVVTITGLEETKKDNSKSINLNNFALYLHSGISICTDVLKFFPDNFYWKLVFR
jgi:hypothetical protein